MALLNLGLVLSRYIGSGVCINGGFIASLKYIIFRENYTVFFVRGYIPQIYSLQHLKHYGNQLNIIIDETELDNGQTYAEMGRSLMTSV